MHCHAPLKEARASGTSLLLSTVLTEGLFTVSFPVGAGNHNIQGPVYRTLLLELGEGSIQPRERGWCMCPPGALRAPQKLRQLMSTDFYSTYFSRLSSSSLISLLLAA